MSFDLGFAVRPGKQPPTIAALRDWMAKRAHWKDIDTTNPEYANDATGGSIIVGFYDDPAEDAARAPFYLSIAGMRPHVSGVEAEEEIRALVGAFDLLVAGEGEYSGDAFLRRWNAYNDFVHESELRSLAKDPPPSLHREALETAWRWNRARGALAARLGDGVLVPAIAFAQGDAEGDEVRTFVAWVEPTPARLPRVDSILTPRKHVAWSTIERALRKAPLSDDPAPHYVVEGDVLARVLAAIDRAPNALAMPRGVPARSVCTKELVEKYALPAAERPTRRRAVDLLWSAQMARRNGRPHEALRMLKEAAALAPEHADIAAELALVAKLARPKALKKSAKPARKHARKR